MDREELLRRLTTERFLPVPPEHHGPSDGPTAQMMKAEQARREKEKMLSPICECDHEFHKRRGCDNPAADHGTVKTDPALCTACLFGCGDE